MNDPHAHRSHRRARPIPEPAAAPALAGAGILAPLVALLLAGCGNGMLGDLPAKPLADEYGPGTRLCSALGPAVWEDAANTLSANCKETPDYNISVTGVTVVAIDTYDETGDGASGNYYVEDTTCAADMYAGITVFAPTFSPPALRVAVNDVVDVAGSFTEFIGPSSGAFGNCKSLPEMSGAMSFRFDGQTPPKPIEIKDTDLKSYDSARPYLGMLVRVTGSPGVVIFGTPTSSKGRYSAALNVGAVSQPDQPHITNELYDILTDGPAMTTGTTFTAVTGIVTYFYGFHIVPRSPADFEP